MGKALGTRFWPQLSPEWWAPPRFGLSFSTFKIGAIAISVNGSASSPVNPCGPTQRFSIAVPVTSSGPAGTMVLQVYVRPTFQTKHVYPANRLLCWSKLPVPANGRATATISCSAQDLGMWDLAVGDYMVKGGKYAVAVAQYSGDPRPSTGTVDVAATPIPRPGESMRDVAEKYAGTKYGR